MSSADSLRIHSTLNRSKVTTRQRQLSRKQVNIQDEVDYIISRAGECDARVVTLGPLVFFSTEAGDAWLLDPGEPHWAQRFRRQGGQRSAGASARRHAICRRVRGQRH